jgi:hypothetical protein
LNYSEHGTTVDNVLYSCDFSEKMGPPQPPPGPSKFSPLVKTIREIVDKRRGVRRKMQETEEETTLSLMMARSGKVKFENMFHIPFSLSPENAPLKDIQYSVFTRIGKAICYHIWRHTTCTQFLTDHRSFLILE